MFVNYKPLNNIVMIGTLISNGIDFIKYILLNQWKDKLEADKKLYYHIKEILPTESNGLYYLNHYDPKGGYCKRLVLQKLELWSEN